MTEETDVKNLEGLVMSDDFGEFVRLCEARPPNVFRIAGIRYREVYLTKVVAWLLSPNESHHLGDRPLRALLLRAAYYSDRYGTGRLPAAAENGAPPVPSVADVLGLDLSDAFVATERPIPDGQLDILVESESSGLVVVVENKIWSGETEGQLEEYEKWVNARKPKIALLVYLTLYGAKPSKDIFIPVAYAHWIPDLKRIDPPGGRKGLVVSQFIANMEEILEMDETSDKLDKLRLSLWVKHPEAMERLSGWSPDTPRFLKELVSRLQKEPPQNKLERCSIQKPTRGYFIIRPSERKQGVLYYCASLNYLGARYPGMWVVGVCAEGSDEATKEKRTQLKEFAAGEDRLTPVGEEKEHDNLRENEWICYLSENVLRDTIPQACDKEPIYRQEPKAENWAEMVEGLVQAVYKLVEIVPPEMLNSKSSTNSPDAQA